MVNQCTLSNVITHAFCIEEKVLQGKEVMFVVTPCFVLGFFVSDNMLTSPPVTDTGDDVVFGRVSSHTSVDPLQNFLASGRRPPPFRLTALKPTQKNSNSRLNLLRFASPVLNKSGANVSSTYFFSNCNYCNFSVSNPSQPVIKCF